MAVLKVQTGLDVIANTSCAQQWVNPPRSWPPLFARVIRADRRAGLLAIRYRDLVLSARVSIEVVRRPGFADEDVSLPKRQRLDLAGGWRSLEVKLKAKDFRLRTV